MLFPKLSLRLSPKHWTAKDVAQSAVRGAIYILAKDELVLPEQPTVEEPELLYRWRYNCSEIVQSKDISWSAIVFCREDRASATMSGEVTLGESITLEEATNDSDRDDEVQFMGYRWVWMQ